MKKICVLSGKGGVGKSSITASLAVTLSKDYNIICADCDVDASNLSLVLNSKLNMSEGIATNEIATVDESKCVGCKKCVRNCYFHAITFDEKPNINETKCEGCGVCKGLCPTKAISMQDIENANLEVSQTEFGFVVVSAQIKMGNGGSGKVVTEVKNKAGEYKSDIMLIDCAAGVGCPVISAVHDCNYALIVTEPARTAFSDMKRAISLLEHFQIPFGVIINKADINDSQRKYFEKHLNDNGNKIIDRFDYNKSFRDALIQMTPVINYDETFRDAFENISKHIAKEAKFEEI